jgi:hypothetical protein
MPHTALIIKEVLTVAINPLLHPKEINMTAIPQERDT